MSRIKKVAEPEVVITEVEKLEAATNDPVLSREAFQFDGAEFKVMHLIYKDYCAFCALLEPAIEMLAKEFSGGFSEATMPSIDVKSVLNMCRDTLPELVTIVCRQSDPEFTVERVHKARTDPFDLMEIVALQIFKNQAVGKFSSFFAQRVPSILKGLTTQVKTTGLKT